MRLPHMYFLATLALFAGVATAQTTVIFLGANNIGADAAIQTFLEARYGKTNVTYQNTEPGGSVTAETIAGYDVAVLSSTPSSGRYRNILHNSTTPIVNMEEAVADNNVAGEFEVTVGRTKETELGAHSIKISADHAITKGFKMGTTVALTTGAAEVWWSTGTQAAGATSLAADDDTATNLFITIVNQGGTLLTSTKKAECRRVMFGMTDGSFAFFTKEGKQLFGQAIDWAADACCAQRYNYGAGLAGTKGIPTLTSDIDPKFDATINVAIANSLGTITPAVLFLGQTPVAVPILGGSFLVNSIFEAPLVLPVNGLTVPFKVPNLAPLCTVSRMNLRFYIQVLQLDAGAAQGVSFTRGLGLRFGM